MKKWLNRLVVIGMAAGFFGGLANEGRAAAYVTELNEGFEGAFPGSWTVIDQDPVGTPAYWGRVNAAFGGESTHSGTGKVYCAGVGYGGTTTNPLYRTNMTSTMRRNINLSGYDWGLLRFYYKFPSRGTDGRLIVRLNGTTLWITETAVASWTQFSYVLTNRMGDTTTELEIIFEEQGTSVGEGAYIDDLQVYKADDAPVELSLVDVSVTRPADPALRTFTACSFAITNNGLATFTGDVLVEYYLSTSPAMSLAGLPKIGETDLTGITIPVDGRYLVSLNAVGCTRMATNWLATTVAAGNYYVFAKVSILSGGCVEMETLDDYNRTAATFNFTALKVLSVTPTNFFPSSAAGSSSFTVDNVGGGAMVWSPAVTQGAAWLSVPEMTPVNGPISVPISWIANSGSPRTGLVVVSSSADQGNPKTVKVVQAGATGRPAVQADASFGVMANQFGFNLNWTSGQTVVVDVCTNLAASVPVWTPLQTNLLTGTPVYFYDPRWSNHLGRFYRLRSE